MRPFLSEVLEPAVFGSNVTNHGYNKILESDWFLARPIFYQIGARSAKVSNNKVNHSYDYRPNWNLLSPITITKQHLAFQPPCCFSCIGHRASGIGHLGFHFVLMTL